MTPVATSDIPSAIEAGTAVSSKADVSTANSSARSAAAAAAPARRRWRKQSKRQQREKTTGHATPIAFSVFRNFFRSRRAHLRSPFADKCISPQLHFKALQLRAAYYYGTAAALQREALACKSPRRFSQKLAHVPRETFARAMRQHALVRCLLLNKNLIDMCSACAAVGCSMSACIFSNV